MFEADLRDKEAFREPMKGCSVVIHSASPFISTKVKDPMKTLIEPAFQGTRNILEAVHATSSVKRVVITSSVVALYGDTIEFQEIPGGKVDEEHWNRTSSLDHQPYAYSKTLAEREAWKMAEEQDRWSLAVINPGFILGPSLTPRNDSTSIAFMLSMAKGQLAMGVPALSHGVVDVRDVALAHILAAFMPEVKGRHILVNRIMDIKDIARVIRKNFNGAYKVSTRTLPRFLVMLMGPMIGMPGKYLRRNLGYRPEFDNSRSIENLGIQYRPVEAIITEHIEQLEKDGLIG